MAIKRISTNLIEDGSIGTIDIANNAITAAKITDGNITTAKLADLNVTAGKLAGTLDLTGKTITVATATTGDSDTSPASTAFVQQEIAALVDSSPDSLNTLNELAAALGDDASFSTTVTNSIATKLPLAGGTMTGALNMGSQHITNVNRISTADGLLDTGQAGSATVFNDSGSTADFRVESTGNTHMLFVDGGLNRVGIGTTSPSSALTVQGALSIRNSTQNFNGGLSSEVNSGVINFGVNEGSGNRFGGSYTQANQGGFMHFDTRAGQPLFEIYGRAAGTASASGTALFNLLSDGKVGIGTSSPQQLLDIKGTAPNIRFTDDRQITWSGTEKLGGVEWFTSDTSANGTLTGASIYCENSVSSTLPNFNMVFATQVHNNSSAPIERMRISSDGNVGIGTNNPSAKLSVSSGSVKIVNSGTDAYFLEGVRDGGNVTLRMYDNNNNLYIDSYTNMTFRANQTGGGSGGNFFFGGGNVGIGLPSGSPDARLTVSGSANSEQVIITGNGNQSRGLSILTAATGGQQDAKVIFNAQDTENVAYPAMQFETGGTEKIRMHHMSTIFSNRVGLNHPSELMFNGEYTAGQQDVAVEAGHAARIEFLKDDFFRIQGSASVSAGAGVAYTDKLKVNIDAGGILFGSDTAAANTLDDYEEGTWTPTITFGGGSTGQTYNRRQGKYIKIGSLVYIQGHLYFTNKGSSTGQAGLAGLPFPPSSNSAGTFSPLGDRGNLNTGGRGVSCYLHSSSTTFPLYDGGFDGSANSDTNYGDFNNSTEIDVNFCYYTDA